MDSAFSSDASSGYIEEKISKSNGETTIRRYAKGKLLGKGGFAKCFQVTNLDNNRISAAKIIEKSSLTKTRARQKLISEIKIHKSLQHTNVVSFEHVFEDHENVYILLELCANQTLNELLKRRKRLTELEVQCYLMQIISALKYMHNNKVIHRDLKLGNLFVSDKMEIKVGDYGLAAKVEFEGEKKKTICGTPNYIAPEILEGKVGHSYEVDVWSVGVIIYTMLIGKPPFETPDVKTTYKKIRMNNYSFPDHVPLSDAAKNLISKILTLDPSRRPNLDDILQHPFLNPSGIIPKLLPVSTIVCPPSASYIKQFLPQAAEVKVTALPQRLLDTAPLSQQSNNKLPNSHRDNLANTDKISLKKSHSNNENVQTFEKQSSSTKPTTSGWNSNNPGTTNFSSTGSNLKGFTIPIQPQKDMMKSTTGFKTLSSATNLINNNGTGGFTGVSSSTRTDTYVKKWVDYSSKYGLGYLLSNGMIGVFFNDSTKIISDVSGQRFEYAQRLPNSKQDVVKSHTMTDYPKELQKKVTLLNHFKSYLEGDNKGEHMVIENESNQESLPYVKKWMKTKHAIIFRLSNKIVQVIFADKTEIILSSENKIVVYVNKKSERTNYPLATALESPNQEMTKRLKYTKEVLSHMLGPNPSGHPQGQDGKDLGNPYLDAEPFAEKA